MAGFLDKLLGRGKKATGDMTNDPELRSEGAHQEAEGQAESRTEQADEMAHEARTDAAEHHAQRDAPPPQ